MQKNEHRALLPAAVGVARSPPAPRLPVIFRRKIEPKRPPKTTSKPTSNSWLKWRLFCCVHLLVRAGTSREGHVRFSLQGGTYSFPYEVEKTKYFE